MAEKEIAQKDSKGFTGFFKTLRTYLIAKYSDDFVIGSIYYGDRTITYFPFTPKSLKEQKLKIAMVYNHQMIQFEIWLAGQNKQIQKKYWEIFKNSNWDIYHIPSSIENGFSIVDHILLKKPDFEDAILLREQIEKKAMEFIIEIRHVLD